MNKIYALYKGDKFIAIGSMIEISKITGLTRDNLRCIKSKTKREVVSENGYVLIEVEDEEGDPNE